MAFLFSDLQSEVKRRATSDQGGTQFDTAVKNIINTSLFRLGREALWRQLRRNGYFTTVTSYTEGSGAVANTEDSKDVAITGATLITDGVKIGRYIKFGGSGTYYTIRSITSETELSLDLTYDGSDATDDTYSILPQEEYNLPVQSGHRMFMWHNQYGYPYKMEYITDQQFMESCYSITETGTPQLYRMWGEDMVIDQPLQAGIISIVSSSASDTTCNVTVFGTVSGYPDYEVIVLNGTTSVNGTKSFSSVERIVKDASTVGRVTVSSDSGSTTVAVLPVGDTTSGILYKKVKLFPLPNAVFDVNVQYYKDPMRLVNSADIHELGQEFDEAIILLSVSKLKYEQNMLNEGDRFISLYQDEVRSLKRSNVDKIDWFPRLKRPNESGVTSPRVHRYLGYNQVGSQYGPRG